MKLTLCSFLVCFLLVTLPTCRSYIVSKKYASSDSEGSIEQHLVDSSEENQSTSGSSKQLKTQKRNTERVVASKMPSYQKDDQQQEQHENLKQKKSFKQKISYEQNPKPSPEIVNELNRESHADGKSRLPSQEEFERNLDKYVPEYFPTEIENAQQLNKTYIYGVMNSSQANPDEHLSPQGFRSHPYGRDGEFKNQSIATNYTQPLENSIMNQTTPYIHKHSEEDYSREQAQRVMKKKQYFNATSTSIDSSTQHSEQARNAVKAIPAYVQHTGKQTRGRFVNNQQRARGRHVNFESESEEHNPTGNRILRT